MGFSNRSLAFKWQEQYRVESSARFREKVEVRHSVLSPCLTTRKSGINKSITSPSSGEVISGRPHHAEHNKPGPDGIWVILKVTVLSWLSGINNKLSTGPSSTFHLLETPHYPHPHTSYKSCMTFIHNLPPRKPWSQQQIYKISIQMTIVWADDQWQQLAYSKIPPLHP